MTLDKESIEERLQSCIDEMEQLKLEVKKKDLKIQEINAKHERTMLRLEKSLQKQPQK